MSSNVSDSKQTKEEQTSSSCIRNNCSNETEHGGTAIQLLCFLSMGLITIALSCGLVNVHTGLFSPHVLLPLIISANSHNNNSCEVLLHYI